MRIISETTVKAWARERSDAAASLLGWMASAKSADWSSLDDVRKTWPHADPVDVASGKTVTIFNIAGNKYRLVTAIHYNARTLYTLQLMTHAEYSKNRWKAKL
ncbi:MAG: type II toxin-antitoxin system HigB family toxin [Pirellulales bacterium]